MELIIEYIITNIILAISPMYVWHKLLDKKIDMKNPKMYISVLLITIFAVVNYIIVNKFLKIMIITIVFMIIFKYLFNEKLRICIITPIFYQLIIMISETIFAMVLILILKKDTNQIIDSNFGELFSNIVICLLSISLININIFKKIYKKIITFTDHINKYQLIFFTLIIMSVSNVLAVISYYKMNMQYILIINAAFTIGTYIIVFYSIRAKNNYNKVSNKYNVAINSLKDYEDMMKKYRIANHENKNLLLTVRAMIINKEKQIPKYIDSIVKEKYNDNEKLLFKMNVIPSGGLRATIYAEILKIKEKNINYQLFIDNNLKTVDLIKLNTETIIDICKIIGVFIDNAIEEVECLDTGNIDISIYVDNKYLVIKVSNDYKNKIELDKIYNEGYTTKGKGHGYGLSLVRKIVKNNNHFENNLEISKDIFSQILKIRIY